MTAHLLAISVGPVQEFIAAARRTRDLWFGSQLLSEISKATAKAIADAGGTLIFPSPLAKEELNPDSKSKLKVANVILAELTADDVKRIVGNVEEAAQAHWISFAQRVFAENKKVINEEIWNAQVGDVTEFFAAWVPTTKPTYKDDRARVMRLLAGRKNGKDFKPAVGKAGVFKSSLDGLRESVLVGKKEDWPEGKQRSLRVTKGEQLDVVGLVKRTALGTQPYPSVARVAADPWIRGIAESALTGLRNACKSSRELHALDTGDFPQYQRFPFEGTAVYATRHREFREEAGLDENADLPFSEPLRQLVRGYGEPNPYLAILVADGDRVGAALSQKTCANEHRDFSKRLAEFAGQAKEIVERNHGVLVYAGGDDVLAFLPVDKCLECARELREKFGGDSIGLQTVNMGSMGNFGSRIPSEIWPLGAQEVRRSHHQKFVELMEKQGKGITLSVGLGIGHFMENLEDLLVCGRAAEKAAKAVDGKDALAIHLYKRGGVPIEVRAPWDCKLDEHLAKMAQLINDKKLSGRVAYDLRRMADLYRDWHEPKDAIQRDVKQLLSAKKPEGGDEGTKEIEALVKSRVKDSVTLEDFAKELLVARLLADILRQAEGKQEKDK